MNVLHKINLDEIPKPETKLNPTNEQKIIPRLRLLQSKKNLDPFELKSFMIFNFMPNLQTINKTHIKLMLKNPHRSQTS